MIGDLRRHQLLAAAGPRTRQRLIEAELGALRSAADWPTLSRTVAAWCESGFNLVRASDALHVHRNTLLYRLGKIERLAGRNLHDHSANLTLYLACLADELEAAPPTLP